MGKSVEYNKIVKQLYHYNTCTDIILEFIHQVKYDTNTENMMEHIPTTKDYCLYDFQKYIQDRISELNPQVTKNTKKVFNNNHIKKWKNN